MGKYILISLWGNKWLVKNKSNNIEEGYTIVEDVFDKDELNPILNEFDEIVDDFAEKAFQAGKIQNKHEDKDVFKRLAALEKDFKGSSVLIHHRGELKPALANLGIKKTFRYGWKLGWHRYLWSSCLEY